MSLRIEFAVAPDAPAPAGPLRVLAAGAATLAALVVCTAVAQIIWPGRSDTILGLAAIFVLAVPFGLAAWRVALGGTPVAERQDGDVIPAAAIGDVVVWLDGGGDVVRVGSSSAETLGLAARDLQARGLLARIHLADRPEYLRAVSYVAHGLSAAAITLRLHPGELTDGIADSGAAQAICVEIRLHRLAVADRQRAAVLALLRNVSSERRHAEELEAARLEAERANEMKGRFLATVSHELRTPLNAIIGFSELLSADHPFVMSEDRRREYAHIIRNSGHHLLEIVNTLLDMSKIESGNFNFEPESFAFGDLASSCCDLMQLKADQAGITIDRAIDQGLPEILADRRACRQILINLVSNAVKFTPAAGIVTVSVSADEDELVLSVQDTGIGIPEADLPRLGDPFFQSGELHRRSHEGTGLGLSVVRGLVGLHRGRLSIESGMGVGTTVTVVLPVTVAGESVGAKPVSVHTRALIAPRPIDRRAA